MRTLVSVLVLGLMTGAIYSLLASGVSLVYRASGVLNLAQAEVGTFGLYITWWLCTKQGVPYVVGAVASFVVSIGICLLFERFFVRRMTNAPKVTIAVATIGLLLLMTSLAIQLFDPTPKSLEFPVKGASFTVDGIVVSLPAWLGLVLSGVVAVSLTQLMRRTDFGLAVLASADDPVAARLMGVPQARVSAFTWGTAGALSALAALLIEPQLGGVFAPGALEGLFLGGLTAAVVGGLTSVTGAFVGGLSVGVLEAGVKALPSLPVIGKPQGLSVGALLLVVLVVLITRPQGLLGKAGR